MIGKCDHCGNEDDMLARFSHDFFVFGKKTMIYFSFCNFLCLALWMDKKKSEFKQKQEFMKIFEGKEDSKE